MFGNAFSDRFYSLVIGFGLCCLLLGAGFPAVNAGEEPMFPGYPFVFSGKGRIEKITPRQVIINDLSHTLAPNISFHSPRGLINRSEFKVGDPVGYIEDARGNIVSLWLLK